VIHLRQLCRMWMESEPKKSIPEVWVYLTPDEAWNLIADLQDWVEDGQHDPDWHTHISDSGRELSIGINPEFGEASFASRFAGPF
jgi:hypothetical protein